MIFACSGAADVGAVADQAARKMTRDGTGKMFCLAGIGGRVKPGLLLDPQWGPTFKATQRDGGAAFGIRRGIGGAIDHPPPEIPP